jgi:hypothetical protein
MKRGVYILAGSLLIAGSFPFEASAQQTNVFQYSSQSGASSDYKPPTFNQKYLNNNVENKYVSDFQQMQKKYDPKKVLTDKGGMLNNKFNKMSYYNNPFYYKHHREINNVRSSFLKLEKNFNFLQSQYGLSPTSLGGLENTAESRATILSKKLLKKKTDSLKKKTGLNKIPIDPNISKYQHMSDQDLVKAVNSKFLSQSSLQDSTAALEKKTNLEGQKLQKEVDLTKAKLTPDHLENLVPSPGSVIKTKYLSHLDSIRDADLKRARLKLNQEKRTADTYVASVTKKESFFKKSYFEGIAGIQPGSFTILQFSPAFATHFSKRISLGVGPNLSLKNDGKNFVATTGLRSFLKAEFFNRQVYGQAEDQINPAISLDNTHFTQHNFLLGGGCVVPFMRPLTFNLALLYKIYSNGTSQASGTSPWVFRVGISSVKSNPSK